MTKRPAVSRFAAKRLARIPVVTSERSPRLSGDFDVGGMGCKPRHDARACRTLERKPREHGESARDALGGIGDARVRELDSRLGVTADGACDLARERVLVGEVIVERALGEIGGADDLIDADGVDPALGEQGLGGAEQRGPVSYPAAIGARGCVVHDSIVRN